MNIKEINEEHVKRKRQLILAMLEQCTPAQQRLFNRMYLGGVDEIPVDKLDWAYEQCRKTVEKIK